MNIKKKCKQIDSLLGDLSSTGINPIPDIVFEIRLLLNKIEAVEQERVPDRLRDEAKLSERKTVHEWLNDAGIPAEEYGKPICLLRRLRIAIDMLPKTAAGNASRSTARSKKRYS